MRTGSSVIAGTVAIILGLLTVNLVPKSTSNRPIRIADNTLTPGSPDSICRGRVSNVRGRGY